MFDIFKTKYILLLAIAGPLLLYAFTFFSKSRKEGGLSRQYNDTTIIALTAVPGLQYDLVRFSVKPGARVKVILKNRDDMSHNLLFTRPGKRDLVVRAAMKLEETGPSVNYIPDSPDVMWSIPVLSPGEEKTLIFIAPEVIGIYPYVCTFPGHGLSMYGAMYVSEDGKMPEIRKDENIPISRRSGDAEPGDHAAHSENLVRVHPYEPTPPYLYRAYMTDSSPASIAVNLPHELSYCWDTESCQLRYAWRGGFVDNTGLWKGKPNSEAKILGTIFYRNQAGQQIRFGKAETIRVVGYKGYRLINRYPQFHYTLDGIDIYELITPTESGDGLIRTFSIPDGAKNIWFYVSEKDGMKYESSAGNWQSGRLMISDSSSHKFSITMTKLGLHKK